MAKTRAEPTQDGAVSLDADIKAEVQQPEQPDIPPVEADAPSPQMAAEEAVILEQEGDAV